MAAELLSGYQEALGQQQQQITQQQQHITQLFRIVNQQKETHMAELANERMLRDYTFRQHQETLEEYKSVFAQQRGIIYQQQKELEEKDMLLDFQEELHKDETQKLRKEADDMQRQHQEKVERHQNLIDGKKEKIAQLEEELNLEKLMREWFKKENKKNSFCGVGKSYEDMRHKIINDGRISAEQKKSLLAELKELKDESKKNRERNMLRQDGVAAPVIIAATAGLALFGEAIVGIAAKAERYAYIMCKDRSSKKSERSISNEREVLFFSFTN